jgi:2,4-dienoyl-CoA reductase-like NADH-dependent reductase (Old Yellow Enzyme family)
MLAGMGGDACAPSAVPLQLPETGMEFATPRAMTEVEIGEVIASFARSALLAERAGFDGVQIDAGHGHLLSQFLSPLSNQRDDAWGGNLANRARLLLESVQAVRRQVRPDFCVSVKLNCSDFVAGGFDSEEAVQVINMLNPLGVDLLEISGGTYASPAMFGLPADQSSLAPEAYFLTQAKALLAAARMPLQLTGGIRSQACAEAALSQGMALVGLATALAQQPDLPLRWQAGVAAEIDTATPPANTQPSAVAMLMQTTERLGQMAAGRQPPSAISPQLAMLSSQIRLRNLTSRYRQWLTRQEASR